MVVDRKELTTAYTNLMGRFPQRSSRGNAYVLIGYHYDGNSILSKAIKGRTAISLTAAWEHTHKTYNAAGDAPKTNILDNEKSNELTNLFTKYNVNYQLFPANCHHSNMTERAIQTFKNHLKAGLASTDPNYPLSEWDRL